MKHQAEGYKLMPLSQSPRIKHQYASFSEHQMFAVFPKSYDSILLFALCSRNARAMFNIAVES
jgi:hypothetical protein